VIAYLRFFVRAIFLILLLLSGLLAAAIALPFMNRPVQDAVTKAWSCCLMLVCGVKVVRHGTPIMSGPVLWVANHVSWIDIFILNSWRATSFIAKQEIRRWPVIGWLVARVGTVFIDRGQRQAIGRVSESMKRLFERNICVGLFPEGTTSDGLDVKPFSTSLFEPAMRAHVAIQPVALVFWYEGQRSGKMAFIGDQTLIGNIWVLLSARHVCVEVYCLPAVTQNGQPSPLGRAELAAQVRDAIRAKVAQG